jgi:hypothetical protein
VAMVKDNDEKIEEFAYNSTTERLKELVNTMNKVLSIDNIEHLKDLGFKYKNSYRLHDILEKASKELIIYTKELERRESNGN